MTKVLNGTIVPDEQDLLTYYLVQTKVESSYVSNEDIASIIAVALKPEDVEDIMYHLVRDHGMRMITKITSNK